MSDLAVPSLRVAGVASDPRESRFLLGVPLAILCFAVLKLVLGRSAILGPVFNDVALVGYRLSWWWLLSAVVEFGLMGAVVALTWLYRPANRFARVATAAVGTWSVIMRLVPVLPVFIAGAIAGTDGWSSTHIDVSGSGKGLLALIAVIALSVAWGQARGPSARPRATDPHRGVRSAGTPASAPSAAWRHSRLLLSVPLVLVVFGAALTGLFQLPSMLFPDLLHLPSQWLVPLLVAGIVAGLVRISLVWLYRPADRFARVMALIDGAWLALTPLLPLLVGLPLGSGQEGLLFFAYGSAAFTVLAFVIAMVELVAIGIARGRHDRPEWPVR